MARSVQPQADEFDIVGVQRAPLGDAYHAYLRAPGWVSIGLIVVVYLAINVAFACVYQAVGGVEGASGSFADAFYFSIQTMGTIGYGTMHPVTPLANALVTVEAVLGLLVTAISTGLVFARISQPRARIAFADNVTISPMDGVPTLQFRIGNERSNLVMDTRIGLVYVRTEVTAEGVTYYRSYDLPLVRAHATTLTRTWSVLHRITPASPLWGATPASLEAEEAELQVTIVGTDDTTLQPIHAGARYFARDILFGHRPTDVLSELPDGRIRVDLRKFHAVEPAADVRWEQPGSQGEEGPGAGHPPEAPG